MPCLENTSTFINISFSSNLQTYLALHCSLKHYILWEREWCLNSSSVTKHSSHGWVHTWVWGSQFGTGLIQWGKTQQKITHVRLGFLNWFWTDTSSVQNRWLLTRHSPSLFFFDFVTAPSSSVIAGSFF